MRHVVTGSLLVYSAAVSSLAFTSDARWRSDVVPDEATERVTIARPTALMAFTFDALRLRDRVELKRVRCALRNTGRVLHFSNKGGWMWSYHVSYGSWVFAGYTEPTFHEWPGAPPPELDAREPERFLTWSGSVH